MINNNFIMKRPRGLYLIILLQVIFVAYDLFNPFLLGRYIYYTEWDFLMAYLLAFLDFILIIGFLRGSRWAWFFGIVYSGINIINYVFSYISNPILLYLILFIMRLIVILWLRGESVRRYFQIIP